MSTTRRVFLRSAVLGAFTLPLVRIPARAHPSRGTGALQLDRIFYDVRRPEALDFADTARREGARTVAISGDLEHRCYEDLRRRWQIAAAPVAGITDFRALFLLQMMASDAGLRPVLRIHHLGRGVSWAHETFASSAYRAASRAHLMHAGTHWSRSAARLVMNLAALERTAMHRATNIRAADLRSFDSRALVTWVIA